MQDLNNQEIAAVSGNGVDWEGAGYAVGYAIGAAASWYYHNILIGDPW